MEAMTATRIGLIAGIVFLGAFVVVVAFAMHAGPEVLVVLALAGLVACGNLLYGRHSHGAAAVERTRPAQEAQNRANDLAAEARKATADAARRGERYCPMDPVRQSELEPEPRQPSS
jgi:predicted tellurium resistance membrane protein TerC